MLGKFPSVEIQARLKRIRGASGVRGSAWLCSPF